MSDAAIIESIRLYRQALQETQALYIESGALIRGSYGWLAGSEADADSIADQMNDLHQGLVMKVFASIVPNSRAVQLEQRQLGRVLLEHLWGQAVIGAKLHEAINWLIDTAEGFEWDELVRPFAQIPSIRDRFGEVETQVMRMANLIAAVDGSVDGNEETGIKDIINGIQIPEGRVSHTPEEPLAIDRPAINHETDTAAARDALAWLRNEAKRLRDGAGGTAAEEPTPTASGGHPPNINLGGHPPNINLGGHPPNINLGGHPPNINLGATSKPKPEVADDRTPEQRLAEARAKLDRLVGLDAIKNQIETLTNFLKMEKQRVEAGLPTTKPSLHMAFVGNPGTGKTTVARIIAEIYGSLGILEKGHLVETDRSGLVAEYAGQTGPKTNAKIDEALDGVLFVDEAYTLIDESGQDQYGREAVQTLLKRMEDQRERLVVILAGYPNEMEKMIRSNPGLSSRVGTTMHFADYGPEALCRIFELIAKKSRYTLPTESRRRLMRGFTYLYMKRDRHFGNGRTSRNSFERSVRRLANRLASIKNVDHDLLTTLEAEDIEVAGVTQAHLAAMAAEPGKVRVTCDDCGESMVIDDTLLGTEVACKVKPNVRFFAEFGEPVMELPQAIADSDEAAVETEPKH